MNRKNIFCTLAIAGLTAQPAAPQQAAETRHLTLTEAVHLAISQNRALKIARLTVVEKEQKKAGEHSAYFPSITNQSNALRNHRAPERRDSSRGLWDGGQSVYPGASHCAVFPIASVWGIITTLSRP